MIPVHKQCAEIDEIILRDKTIKTHKDDRYAHEYYTSTYILQHR